MTDVVSIHETQKTGEALTPTMQGIASLLRLCQESRLIGVITGEPGTGKTTAIEHYASDKDNVWVCRMSKARAGMQPMLSHIAKLCGVYANNHAGAGAIHDAIVESFSYYSRQADLLIIDEAQYLANEALEAIRDLYDESNLAIVLVGNGAFLSRLEKPKSKSIQARKQYLQFEPLVSRIGQRLDIPQILKQDIQVICDNQGISSRDSVGLVQKVAETPGQLHRVGSLLRVAKGRLGEQQSFTHNSLKEAARSMGVQ